VRQHLGLAPQALAIYDDLSAQENLAFFGQLYGMRGGKLSERVDWALSLAGLTDRRKHLAKTFSGGMKRRLNLACALVHDPPVLLLDEPTAGVDLQSRNHIFDCIESLRNEGRTVLYTTHYMEEAERLCDRVAIMDRGKILALDTVPNLISAHGGESILEVELAHALAETVSGFSAVDEGKLLIATRAPHTELARLAAAGGEVAGLALQRPSLESVFLTLTGRSLRDE
jgi:ABC-2 type transport system ATP-binding protein